MPEADQPAAGYWYGVDDAALAPVAVLNALRRYRTAEQDMRRRLRASMGMGETDLAAMRYLLGTQRDRQIVTATDLARHLGISSASTTVLIDRLARAGHVQRGRHPTDRRAVVVIATADSDREVRDVFGALHDEMLAAVAELEPGELRVVQGFLDRMRTIVEAAGRPAG